MDNNKNSVGHRPSRDKRKRRSGQQLQHHPWDEEVSLPGAACSEAENSKILKVLNTPNTIAVDEVIVENKRESAEINKDQKHLDVDQCVLSTVTSKDQIKEEAKSVNVELLSPTELTSQTSTVVSSGDENVINSESLVDNVNTALKKIDSVDSANVLDIESHLIETYDEYVDNDDSVGIKELPPIQYELSVGPSEIETDKVVRTVIEVEPVGVQTKQPIETVIQLDELRARLADNIDSKETSTTATVRQQLEVSEDIKRAAEILVRKIESEALEAVRQQVECPNIEKDNQKTEAITADESLNLLSQRVDEQLSEVTSILKKSSINGANISSNVINGTPSCDQIKLVDVPSPKTEIEAEERKLFIDSLPQISTGGTDSAAQKLASDCKREYYQSLKKYLLESTADKPPVPLQTYRWEDLKRARERGGYPWTHLYKRPLGPDEEPEIVLLLRKSQELRFASESPKSLKKVRIDDQVLIKETERYILELSEDEEDTDDQAQHNERESETEEEGEDHSHLTEDAENHSLHSESISCVSDSVLATNKPRKPYLRLANIRAIIKRRRSGRSNEDAQSLPGTLERKEKKQPKVSRIQLETTDTPQTQGLNGEGTPQKTPRCFPIMKKLKSMADRQKKRLQIKRVPLKKDERIVLNDETKILKLKKSPKAERSEIPHFIEKQDSDDVLEIVELDESPSRKRKDDCAPLDDDGHDLSLATSAHTSSIVQPDEVIDIVESKVSQSNDDELKNEQAPPKKTPRLRREHVYEEITQVEAIVTAPSDIIEIGSTVEALKSSLQKQDTHALNELENATKQIPLDRMGSSEEDAIAAAHPSGSTLAPISSIDSTSSDEDRNRAQLSPVSEESDAASSDYHLNENEIPRVITENEQLELKSSIKKESSPAPSDKKVVTFSHVEDEAEPHREDIELPEHVLEATAAQKKTKAISDHEYEPIGVSNGEGISTIDQNIETNISAAIETLRDEMKEAEELQKDLEERYFSSETTTPRTESRTDYEIHTSQVDSSALEELPLKPENRKKGFMATAQDRTRKMQAGFKNQAGKIKTKLRSSTTKKPPSGSPKAKERRRFKAPEFSKMKMPELKRPDMSKFKDFKRPEFTKFNKPDMSKFKLPEKFSTLKLHRSKSLKENEIPHNHAEMAGNSPEAARGAEGAAEPQKKLFEFNFGTYPRAFRKKKKPVEPLESSFGTGSATEGPSVIPSTDTQPSFESSSSPQGDRGPGPVRSRWADKFSDVSYNDSEGSRYRRYGSEQESFDRESSLERRMKDDLEDTGSEAPDMGIINRTGDNKQFAEFDEENRAIHEISNLRAGEFKRRPMVHQDSDLRSEDSRDAVGWTDKEIQKIKLLRKAELEAESSYLKFPSSEEGMTQETQSTASSGKKVVMEEIDDDEFFLRKRGVSEDNIELRQYISKAIREGYDLPMNALEHVGTIRQPIEYADYDIPPPKPRRLHKSFRPEYTSQELGSQRSDYGDDLSMSQNGSDFFGAPKRPMRKGRSRSKYSIDSQDIPVTSADDEDLVHRERYFDDDEEYLRPPQQNKMGISGMNNLDFTEKQDFRETENSENFKEKQPLAPRRRKRHLRDTSIEKDSFISSLSGRSVSNNYLQPTEDVIVYRTEHEYYKPPLATPENYTDGGSTPSHKSRLDDDDDDADDDHISGIADSIEPDLHYRYKYEDEVELGSRIENDSLADTNASEKFVIDMMENDGYAVVRKEQLPKPTPPARRKKFTRSPGERFATLPNASTQHGTPPPERPPPPRGYTPLDYHRSVPLGGQQKESIRDDEDDYEEPGLLDNDRPESPRDLQSGEVINKMKFRPLPPPPRPPREKRQRNDSKRSAQDYDEESESNMDNLGVTDHKRLAVISSDESYAPSEDVEDFRNFQEVEVSTQTDPLPDDFVCEEFEITEDMRIIEPRHRQSPKTLEDLLKEDQTAVSPQLTEDEQLARGLQRFRDANQRTISERSRASSQADRSKSLSRPQTPSAIIIERRVSTPVPSHHENETMLEAALIVRPIDDLDLEEEALRREGLLTDSSQQSKSDAAESQTSEAVEEDIIKYNLKETSLTPSFTELERAVENLRSLNESEQTVREEHIESEGEHEIDDNALKQRMLHDYGYDEEKTKDADRYSEEYDEEKELSEYEQEHMKQLDEELEQQSFQDVEKRLDQAIENIIERHIRADHTEDKYDSEHLDSEVPPPQPPPRRKSTIGSELTSELTITEDKLTAEEITPAQAAHTSAEQKIQLPNYVGDLEVERLRVRALQAGQIMVSQLHGGQISAEELECKSGNLIVKGLELPAGFIEDIVDRVRSTERAPLLTTETQTSLQSSSELLAVEQPSSSSQMMPPPKPPRQKDVDHSERHRNDEETQTDVQHQPPVFATTEYLETLVPLLRRDLENKPENESNKPEDGAHMSHHHHHQCRSRHHHRHHHHHYRRCSSSSSDINDEDIDAKDFEADSNYRASSSLSNRQHSRSRSRTRPPSECPSQSVSQAGRQFISACSLSLVNIIDQLTASVRGTDSNKDEDPGAADPRRRHFPTLVVLFIVITFGVLLFLLSGRNVHTHHWDFFNPPGNEGRQS